MGLAFIGVIESICSIVFTIGFFWLIWAFVKKKSKKKAAKTMLGGFCAILIMAFISEIFYHDEMEQQRIKREEEKALAEKEEKEKKIEEEKNKEYDVWLDGYTDLEDFDYYINGNELHIKRYNGDEEKIRVKSSYDGKDVVAFEDATFLALDVTSVIIPEGTKHIDNSTFNSCGVKYIFLPSTLENVENSFWSYLHDVEKIYYGGTNEQWNAMCQFGRKGIDAKELFCEVNPDDLGTEKSESTAIVMEEYVEDTKETDDSEIEESSLSQQEQFIEDSSEYLSSDVSNKLYSIIISDLGFEEVRFMGKSEAGDSIWTVYCDDISVTVTASDDVYMIWSGDYTFYDSGVVMTKQQMESTLITSSQQTSYYLIAKEIVSQNLKNPGSASFPSASETGMVKKDNVVAVQGYVDATNSFGGYVRSQWTVEFRVTDLDSFSYETIYINIDGQSSGTYIELN